MLLDVLFAYFGPVRSRCSVFVARCSGSHSWWTGARPRWSPCLPGQQCAAGEQRRKTQGEREGLFSIVCVTCHPSVEWKFWNHQRYPNLNPTVPTGLFHTLIHLFCFHYLSASCPITNQGSIAKHKCRSSNYWTHYGVNRSSVRWDVPASRWQWRGRLCGSCWRRRGASGGRAAGRRPAAWPWGLPCRGWRCSFLCSWFPAHSGARIQRRAPMKSENLYTLWRTLISIKLWQGSLCFAHDFRVAVSQFKCFKKRGKRH